MTRNRGVRPIGMRLTLALTSLSLSLCTIGSASDESGTSLLDAARRAGTEASPLVFEREADTAPDAEVGGRRSGKSIVLATVIASAALVTTAWLVSRNSGSDCRPDPRFSRSLDYWTTVVSGRWVTLDDGTRAIVPGPSPHPPLGPPGATFPDLCVAR